MQDRQYVKLLANIWEFLAPSETVAVADAIFVFGGIDMLVPRWAADLWNQGVADRVLVTGNAGLFTREHFQAAEADVFAEEMIRLGVPESSIIRERAATNTGENVTLGMPLLAHEAGTCDLRLALVAKPFIMRRCIQTFAKHYPDIEVVPSPPPYGMLASIDRDRSTFALRLVAELDRLEAYAQKGFIEPVAIPQQVLDGAERVKREYEPA